MKRSVELKPRKIPRQDRSRQMNEFIMVAATRILRAEGALGFTTNKVADEAGISVGSLYQYYPNKAALLFHLHEREAHETWRAIEAILDDQRLSPRERITNAVFHFFMTEAEEAELRTSLKQAEVFFHETKEFRALQAQIFQKVSIFLGGILPRRRKDIAFLTEVFMTIVASVAENVSGRTADPEQLRKWAQVVSTMLCNYIGVR